MPKFRFLQINLEDYSNVYFSQEFESVDFRRAVIKASFAEGYVPADYEIQNLMIDEWQEHEGHWSYQDETYLYLMFKVNS